KISSRKWQRIFKNSSYKANRRRVHQRFFYVQTEEAEVFMKFHANSPPGFFKSESTGLRLIKETNTISVPNHLSYSDQQGNAFLLLEWIEGKKNADTEEILGQKLAEFHQCTSNMHGFHTD